MGSTEDEPTSPLRAEEAVELARCEAEGDVKSDVVDVLEEALLPRQATIVLFFEGTDAAGGKSRSTMTDARADCTRGRDLFSYSSDDTATPKISAIWPNRQDLPGNDDPLIHLRTTDSVPLVPETSGDNFDNCLFCQSQRRSKQHIHCCLNILS